MRGRIKQQDVFDVHGQVVGELIELGGLMPQEFAKLPLPYDFVLQRFRRRVIYAGTAERYLQELAKKGLVQYYDVEMHDYPQWLLKFFENPPEEVVFLLPTSNVPPITILYRVKLFTQAVFNETLTKEVFTRANLWALTEFYLAEILSEQFEKISGRTFTRGDMRKFYATALEGDRSFYQLLMKARIIDFSEGLPRVMINPREAAERANQVLLSMYPSEVKA